jgi:uncharacterized phage protein gp47/JayE
MSGTLSPTAAYVDATGIHAPDFATVQAYLISQFQAIYGTDIVVDPSTQDGQLIGVLALAIADTNAACIAAYNAFSPSTAQGTGLSNVVKINGLVRHIPSNSTAPLLIGGSSGTVIINGVALDSARNPWNLPPSVIIPPGGSIAVTGTCAVAGAISAPVGDINRISTVTLGWQTVTNTQAATVGSPVESDAFLRIRQTQSTALPAMTVLDGIVGAVASVAGVVAVKGYENDTNSTDPITGIPAHSISMVVQGGDNVQIAQTILLKKTPGCFTYGNQRQSVNDFYGLPHDIGFFIPSPIQVGVKITVKAKTGYSTVIGAAISQNVSAYINGLGSGVVVSYSKLWTPANLVNTPSGGEQSDTYDITAMTIATPVNGTYATVNIPITIYQIANCTAANVVITVT